MSVTLKTKLDVLHRFDIGERAVNIGIALGLPPTTVRTIRTNAEKIKSSVEAVTPRNSTRISKSRDKLIENMEKHLNLWLEDKHHTNIPISLAIIQCQIDW